jgi:glyoxylase-like metal-dependent hydrolase (beta-lactamase superfamily II)
MSPPGWRVGGVRVGPVVEITTPLPTSSMIGYDAAAMEPRPAWLTPYYSAEGMLPITVQTFVVETGDVRILVDTCLGNDREYDIPAPTLHTAFLSDLAAVGAPAESIDFVVCTHLHIDHVGWNTRLVEGKWVPTFPNARYLFGRAEYEHWLATESELIELEDTVAPVLDAGLHQFVETDHQITEGVRLQPSPGHTPGHVSVRIDSEGEEALITGDMVHHPVQLLHPDWHSHADGDPALAEATRRAIFGDASSRGTLVIGTHFAAPAAGRLVADGGAWRFEGVPSG